MKDLIKLHNPDKFLKNSSFSSNFRDLQKLAQQSFWIYFGLFFMEFIQNPYPVMQRKVLHTYVVVFNLV